LDKNVVNVAYFPFYAATNAIRSYIFRMFLYNWINQQSKKTRAESRKCRGIETVSLVSFVLIHRERLPRTDLGLLQPAPIFYPGLSC
jgi:hypothetical protein